MRPRTARMLASGLAIFWLILIAVPSPAEAPGSCPVRNKRPPIVVEFPYLLRIAEGSVLVVHGHDFRDSVWITWENGDSMRVEGLPVVPPPPVPRKVLSEGAYASLYGKVPYVRSLVDSGATWREAYQVWSEKRKEIERSMVRLYNQIIDSTGSHEAAVRAVDAAIDRSLLEPGARIEVTSRYLEVTWQGRPREQVMCSTSTPLEGPLLPLELDAERMRSSARRLAFFLAPPRKSPAFVNWNPRGFGAGGGQEAIDQLEMAKRGVKVDGFMDYTELERIFRVNVTSEAQRARLTGTVCGTVVDADDGTPLDLVAIYMEHITIRTGSDSLGKFEVSGLLTGRYKGYVTRLGYKSVTLDSIEVRAGERTELSLELQRAGDDLRE
jgi:hypothetical protein